MSISARMCFYRVVVIITLPLMLFLASCRPSDRTQPRPGHTERIKWLQSEISGYRVGVKTLPPHGMRETVLFQRGTEDYLFSTPTDGSLRSVTPCEIAGRVYSILRILKSTKLSPDGVRYQGFYDFYDLGYVAIDSSVKGPPILEWKSILGEHIRQEFIGRRIFVTDIKIHGKSDLLITIRVPTTKDGNVVEWVPREVLYQSEDDSFLPPISDNLNEAIPTNKVIRPLN